MDPLNKMLSEMEDIKKQIQSVQIQKTRLLNNVVDDVVFDDEIYQLESQLESKNEQYNNLLQLREYQSLCNHDFVDDLIDLTPDTSKMITYCVHCLLEK
jgi:ABC-type phosphate transport system auxiliary subunit